eukprot:3952821-Pyramimonas_sp.AAC.1
MVIQRGNLAEHELDDGVRGRRARDWRRSRAGHGDGKPAGSGRELELRYQLRKLVFCSRRQMNT